MCQASSSIAKRSEQALISVIQEAVVKGVSTRKIEAVLEELGIAGVSAGQISQLYAASSRQRNRREIHTMESGTPQKTAYRPEVGQLDYSEALGGRYET
jgi:hypothetical protein